MFDICPLKNEKCPCCSEEVLKHDGQSKLSRFYCGMSFEIKADGETTIIDFDTCPLDTKKQKKKSTRSGSYGKRGASSFRASNGMFQ